MKSSRLFYVLVAYVFLQFCAWAYLLIKFSKEHYFLELHTQGADPVKLANDLHGKYLMVAGEGIVFLTLLFLGAYYTQRSFKKEVLLNRQQRNFLLSVTHEFKSPLAAIRLYLQTLSRHDLEKEKKEAFLKNAIDDVDRLDALVEQTLLASQLDKGGFNFHFAKTNVSELLHEVLAKFPPNRLETNIDKDIYIKADDLSLRILLKNLIENALKYSNEKVSVELYSRNQGILLRVSDQGSGIPHNERGRIFEKFYRIGNEDTRNNKGTGLGLFIVKHIAEAHKARIHVKDNSPKGSIFEVLFEKYE